MFARCHGLWLATVVGCADPPAPAATPFEAWSPRQVRATARSDGTVEEELLRPDRTVSLVATVRREHTTRLRGLDRHGREAWDCELNAAAPPRCVMRTTGGQLLDAGELERRNQSTAALLAAPTAVARSARDRRWLERAEELTHAGLPLAIAAPLAREELASGFYYLPERRPISDADHWH
jgi:hypothetical protein